MSRNNAAAFSGRFAALPPGRFRGNVQDASPRHALAFPGRCAVRYYDISLNLSTETVRWVVAPPLEVHERRRMHRGDDVNATALTVSVHAGTHVDAPFHFLPDGAGIDEVPLEKFAGPALVHAVSADRYIAEAHVNAIPLDGVTRVLFKTRNSDLLKRREFAPDFVAFSVDAARALVARGVELVGLDYLSVAHADEQVPVHRAFLDHG